MFFFEPLHRKRFLNQNDLFAIHESHGIDRIGRDEHGFVHSALTDICEPVMLFWR
jgi:hypothetical protein